MALTGKETLHGLDDVNGTALDFWRWAFSDIKSNTLRGIYAEWLVARILSIPTPGRIEWENHDLVTSTGVKIEVKSAGVRQTWHKEDSKISNIKFSGLKSKLFLDGKSYAIDKTFNADIYIFCVHIESDIMNWDAFNIEQWRFYVVDREIMLNIDQTSISVSTILNHCPEMEAAEFRMKTLHKIDQISLSSK